MAVPESRKARIQKFLDALYEKMREYGVVTTVCYEEPIRKMIDDLLEQERGEALRSD